jgi:hypothetical protein
MQRIVSGGSSNTIGDQDSLTQANGALPNTNSASTQDPSNGNSANSSEESGSDSGPKTWVIGVGVGAAILVLVVLSCILFYCKRRTPRRTSSAWFGSVYRGSGIPEQDVLSRASSRFQEKAPLASEKSYGRLYDRSSYPSDDGRSALSSQGTLILAPPNSREGSEPRTPRQAQFRAALSAASEGRSSIGSKRQVIRPSFLGINSAPPSSYSKSTRTHTKTVSSARSGRSSPSLSRWRISDVPAFEDFNGTDLPPLPAPASIAHAYTAQPEEEQIKDNYASSYHGSKAADSQSQLTVTAPPSRIPLGSRLFSLFERRTSSSVL